MEEPVNLTNLRSMTDGDKEMEKELFKEFITSFEAGLHLLRASCNDSAPETWRTQSHSLKGMSLNLGAEKLGELCKRGQDEYLGSSEIKNGLLQNISAEYERVRQFLLGIS